MIAGTDPTPFWVKELGFFIKRDPSNPIVLAALYHIWNGPTSLRTYREPTRYEPTDIPLFVREDKVEHDHIHVTQCLPDIVDGSGAHQLVHAYGSTHILKR